MKNKPFLSGGYLPSVCILLALLLMAACSKVNSDKPFNQLTNLPSASFITASNPLGTQVSTVLGNGSAATLNSPGGVAIDAAGNIYVADNNRIQKITPAGSIMPVAGDTAAGFRDTSVAAAARFNAPTGLAVDAAGNVLVADRGNNRIRKITPAGVVSTIAGSDSGFVDGPGLSAQFHAPSGVAIDTAGNIYVTDTKNYCIRLITTFNQVFTIAGVQGTKAIGIPSDAATGTALFNYPTGITLDAVGNIYVADSTSIRKIANGQVTGLAGNTTVNYTGVIADASSNLYVADQGHNRILLVTPGGVTSPYAGSGVGGFLDASITSSKFSLPTGVAIDGASNVYVADAGNNRLRKVKSPVAVAAGGDYSLLLSKTLSLWAAGNNSSGQLGDGTTTNRNVPVKIMDNVQSMAAGPFHSLILKTDNSLWATGNNQDGELGDGTTTNKSTPVQIMGNVQAMAAGLNHSCMIKIDNTLWATGNNLFGQLGDGTTTNRTTPGQIMTNVKAVATGTNFTLILKTDNSVWATGFNLSGQLGDGTIVTKTTPVKVMDNVIAIAAGNTHSLMLKSDNSLWGTGQNTSGQLGIGTTTNVKTPVKIMDNVQAMAGGDFFTLILKTDNTLWATGLNTIGQLGDGTTTNKNIPVKVQDNVLRFAAGADHSLIYNFSTVPFAVGFNFYGELGNGTNTTSHSWVKMLLP